MAPSPSRDAREERLRTLARLSHLVSASLDLDEVLPAIARAAAELMSLPSVSFWIADEPARQLEARAFSAPELYADFPTKIVPFGVGVVGWVAQQRRALDVPDVFADKRVIHPDWWRAHGIRSLVAIPVTLGERVLAVLVLAGREPRHRDADDEELLEAFAARAALAIRNGRLFAESESRRRIAEELAELSRLVSQTLDLERVAQRIADRTLEELGALSCSVYHLEPETEDLIVMATSSTSPAFEWALVLPRGTGVAGLAVQQRAPVATPDLLSDPRITMVPAAREYVERSANRAALAVPFMIQGRVIGALAVGDRSGRVFDDVALRVAQAFANQAALALENARLFEEAELRRQAAEEAEARYRGLFEGVPVGLYRSGADGRLLDANPALVQMLGYPDLESFLASDPVDHYVDPDDRHRWRILIEQAGVVRDHEIQLRRRDGRVIWVRRSARVVRDQLDRTLYIEGVQQDITEQKRVEEAEHRAETLRSVARLANAAAHEINNPLSVIVGRLELMTRRLPPDDPAQAGIEQATAAGRRISEIIAHMGRITRLEVIEQSPGLEPILDLRKSGAQPPDSS